METRVPSFAAGVKALAGVALALTAPLFVVACGGDPPSPPLAAEVATESGVVRGRTAGDLLVFEGIPYAQPPVGDLRWAPPRAVTPWQGVLDATRPGPACVQPQGPEGGFYTRELAETSEDCLTLNVWTGAQGGSERRPVLYWIHGGGLVNGSGSEYPGHLLAGKGVVLVTINYRLGPFGFFAHRELSEENGGVSGNQGIRDQIAGLEWVRDNIAAFGGDPGNVTIFGESAGALSVSLVQASPLAKGLFHRAIGQSGGSFQPMTRLDAATPWSESAESIGESFAVAIAEGAGSGATLADLRSVPPEQILDTFQRFNVYDRTAIVDGEVIPDEVAAIFARGEQSNVPVMIGSNADEGSTFLPYFEPAFGTGLEGFRSYLQATLPEVADDALEVYSATDDETAKEAWQHVFADLLFTYPQRIWARSMESVSSPAYLYYFTWEPPVPESDRYGSFHAADIGYVFGNLDLFGAEPTESDRVFSERISDLWVRFATTGDPNGGDIEGWQPYTAENESYYVLGPESGPETGLRLEQVELIDRAFESRREGDDSNPFGP